MKMGGKVSRNSPDNEQPSAQVSQCHPGLWRRHVFSDLQGDPGARQCFFRSDSEEGPAPIPSYLHEGEDQHLV